MGMNFYKGFELYTIGSLALQLCSRRLLLTEVDLYLADKKGKNFDKSALKYVKTYIILSLKFAFPLVQLYRKC